jgi:hypothetical protein
MPLPDFLGSALGATLVLLAQSGIDSSGHLIDGYMSGSLLTSMLAPPHPIALLAARSFSGALVSLASIVPATLLVASGCSRFFCGCLLSTWPIRRLPLRPGWPSEEWECRFCGLCCVGGAWRALTDGRMNVRPRALIQARLRAYRISPAGFWVYVLSVGLYQLMGFAFVVATTSRLISVL